MTSRPRPGLCAVVFAAGEGTRLRPITTTIPKPLCPVGNVPLLDRALARLAQHWLSGPALVAVNACYLADAIADHVGGRAFVSREPGPHPLGTAGALGHLRDWIGERAVLAGNADAYLAPRNGSGGDLTALLDGWDTTTVRVLAVPAGGRPAEFTGLIGSADVTGLIGSADVDDLRFAGFSLIPADVAAKLPEQPSDLVHAVWRPAERDGRLEVIRYDGRYLDTGTPPDLLAANLDAADGESLVAPDAVVSGSIRNSVVGAGAHVLGSINRCLVFPGGRVAADEDLTDAIRVGSDLTVRAATAG